MRSQGNTASSSGIGALGLLGVAFVVLKLAHVIDWPWIWVLAPFWAGLVLVVIIAWLIVFIVFTVTQLKKAFGGKP
jgi:hypothetical protein